MSVFGIDDGVWCFRYSWETAFWTVAWMDDNLASSEDSLAAVRSVMVALTVAMERWGRNEDERKKMLRETTIEQVKRQGRQTNKYCYYRLGLAAICPQ